MKMRIQSRGDKYQAAEPYGIFAGKTVSLQNRNERAARSRSENEKEYVRKVKYAAPYNGVFVAVTALGGRYGKLAEVVCAEYG